MKTQTATNLLLGVIAICLLLITGKLYNVGVETSAYAHEVTGTVMARVGPPSAGPGPSLIPVALYGMHGGVWFPCQISDDDKLFVQVVH